MKTFVVAFTVFAVIAASSFVAASPKPGYGPPAVLPSSPSPYKLGTLLKNCISSLVQQIIQVLSAQVLARIPGSTTVPLLTLIGALKPLKTATVATLLTLLGSYNNKIYFFNEHYNILLIKY